MAVNVVPFATIVYLSLSHQQRRECIVGRDQRTAGKDTTVCEAPIQFIFAHMYPSHRENREQDTGLSTFQING